MILPQHILKLVSPEDRKRMGKAGRLPEETLAKGEAKSERELQNQIESLLRLHGIEVIRSRMDRKTSNNIGCPDFIFAVCGEDEWAKPRVFACAWEIKVSGKHLDEAQRKMKKWLTYPPNNWTHRTIYSVDQARDELRAMGLE